MADLAVGRERAKNAALLFFAFVGFVASTLSVVEFFKPDLSSSLKVEATAEDFRVPLYVGQNLSSGSSARLMAKEFKDSRCSNVTIPGIASMSLSELAALPLTDQQLLQAAECRDAIDIEYAARWSGGYTTGYSTLYKYEMENSGSAVAKEIRIKADDVVAMQFSRGRQFLDLKKDASGDFYNLPDLNPKEAITVLIWSDNWEASQRLTDQSDFPSVSYSGSKVSFRVMKDVPSAWHDVYDFANTFPIWLLIPFIIAIAFAICFAVVFVISLIDALVTGKPISSIFKTATDEKGATPKEQVA